MLLHFNEMAVGLFVLCSVFDALSVDRLFTVELCNLQQALFDEIYTSLLRFQRPFQLCDLLCKLVRSPLLSYSNS